MVVDFNVPNTRDLTKLKSLCVTIASALRTTPSSAALVWAPDHAKQGSNDSMDEEDAKIAKELRAAGLDPSRRLRSILRPHPNAVNKTAEFPWWADARLVIDASGDANANRWLTSQVVWTQRFHIEFVLPATKDLLDITTLTAETTPTLNKNRDSFFKSAQKGPCLLYTSDAADE